MLDFKLNAQELEWQQKIQFFVKEHLLHRTDLDRHAHFPIDLYQKAFDAGIITSMIPSEYGGGGKTMFEGLLGAIECAYGDLGFTTSAYLLRLSATPLLQFGTRAQIEKWITPLTRELGFASFCFTEPEGSTNLGQRPASTTATPVQGGYLINGFKATISNATYANYYAVFARINDQESGLTCFIVPKEYEGIKLDPPYRKMGQRAADTAKVEFQNVFIPEDHQVGKIGQGAQIALRSLRQSRLGIGAMAVGVCMRALDLAREHCHNRQTGQGRPVIFEQNIKFRFAELQSQVEMLRSFLFRGCWEMEHGKEATFYSSAVKLQAGRIAQAVTSECIDLLGGRGYLEDSLVEKLYRDAKLLSIYEGTEAVQQLLIADSAIRIRKAVR